MEKNKKVKKPVISEEEKQQAGMIAADAARAHILKACDEVGLTVKKVAQTIVEALDANKVVAQLDYKTGEFAISEPFADYVARLEAVKRAEDLLDLKPDTKIKAQVGLEGLSDEEIDRRLNTILGKK